MPELDAQHRAQLAAVLRANGLTDQPADYDSDIHSWLADAWDAGMETGVALAERGYASPNPYRSAIGIPGRRGMNEGVESDTAEVIHEQRAGVCVGCTEGGQPVEWLLAEARGHSDERPIPPTQPEEPSA